MLFRNKAKYIILISGVIAFGAIGSMAVHAESLDYNVSIQPSLAVTIPSNTVSLNLNPFTTPFNTASLPVTVSTNNPTGFSLTMSSTDTNLTLRSGSETIPTLATNTGGYSESDFTTNAWGYKLSTATNYSPFALSNQLLVTDAPTNATTSTVTFAAKADSTKPAGTYELAINFTAVANYVPPTPFSLYNSVAALSKGKNTEPATSHFSWTEITTPTTTDPSTDTSTSGVFEWDGQDSNGGSQKIYFYRGILNNDGSGTRGSDGSANAYPNYVKLANNTCWRIVRTTSTGGVKMMYNGMWNSSTSTCANATTSAQLTTSPFNTGSATVSGTTYTGLEYHNIHAVGYTYSNLLAAGTTDAAPISTIFGSTGDDTTTNAKSSIIKQYLESWYGSNMTAYTDKLEGDAGYCNDRTLNAGTSWTTPLTNSDTIIPYGTTGLTAYYFGSYPRNTNSSTFSPTLTCPRGKVDLYSYTNNAGNGNGQLTYPVALLTADEASLAGNGWTGTSAYNAKSYLRSGSGFWLLSPSYRPSGGTAFGFFVFSSGALFSSGVYGPYGVRPVISLSSGTRVLGSGTATDPWEVQ